MKNKSIFGASFEESLNLEDDGFVQYYKKEQDAKIKKLPKNGYSSFKIKFISLLLTFLFPLCLNFLILPLLMVIRDSENLTTPIFEHELLTVQVYLVCLLVWLGLVLTGKIFKQEYLFPYRYHFHTVTYLLWLILEINLAGIELTLPILSALGLLSAVIVILFIGCWMFKIRHRNIVEWMYQEKLEVTKMDKVAKILAVYGASILGVLVLIKYMFQLFIGDTSNSLKGFSLLLSWFVLNLGFIAFLIFMEFPYFLQAYYKWKYPEEYREWEGKTLEEWYGKKYLKKHKELLENE